MLLLTAVICKIDFRVEIYPTDVLLLDFLCLVAFPRPDLSSAGKTCVLLSIVHFIGLLNGDLVKTVCN